MSMIEVDIDTIKQTQQAIANYIEVLNNKTSQTGVKVAEMESSWKGKDYERFKNKWTQLTNSSSIALRTKRELESFNQYLITCYTEYEKLQAELINN